VNYLVLSWRINKQLSLPLFFVELDKAGNSNTANRIDLLEAFDKAFGFQRINSLIADREFVGEKWFKMLTKNKIPFFIRVKENILLPAGETPIQAKKLFHPLKEGRSKRLEAKMYGATVYLAGTLSSSGERVIVMTNQPLKAAKILAKYRERWSIEELFRKLKTAGFHWENTHMKQSARLVSLLIILGFALLIAYLVGHNEKIPWKKTLHCPLYSIFKRGLINFQFMIARCLATALKTILSLLKRAHYMLFIKSDG
jgi:transposase